MKFNFKNRVRNFKLATSDAFVPLYEAITNSIQALDERGLKEDGYINIRIERDSYRITDYTPGIFAIEITDNGIGFIERNYDSFCTSDSDYKVEIGGKGVGRINWLKAFEMIYVTSVFEENQKRYERSFQFNIDNEIHNETFKEVDSNAPIETKIFLRNLHPEFRTVTEIPLKDIANKIIEHFATGFVIGSMPKMEIKDEMELIDLNEFFVKEKFIYTKGENFISNGSIFEIRHVFLNATSVTKHRIYICAQNRVVCSYELSNIQDLPTYFNIDDKKAIYQCYVSGDFLDKDVNSERTYFSNVIFEEENQEDQPHFELGINLYEIVYNQINEFLKNYLLTMRNLRDNQINEYLQIYYPQYKYLIKYAPEELENISYLAAANKERLGIELTKLHLKFNKRNTDQISKALKDGTTNVKTRLLDLVMPLCENLRSEFSNFINKRNAAIEILERLMVLDVTTEELVNNYFIPNPDESSDANNLWLVDEELAYPYKLINTRSNDEFLYVYANDDTNKAIAILFLDYKKIKFEDENPVELFKNALYHENISSKYHLKKYLIVGDTFGIVSEGLTDKNTTIISYQDIISYAKALNSTFNNSSN